MPDLLTGLPSPMDDKIIAGARQQQREASEKRYTRADVSKAESAAYVLGWNEAIDAALEAFDFSVTRTEFVHALNRLGQQS